jgi:excisionase family DNA binding protein
MERVVLTPVEAAKALGVCRSTLYGLLRSGALRSVKIGACRRIPVEAVREYVAERGDDWWWR